MSSGKQSNFILQIPEVASQMCNLVVVKNIYTENVIPPAGAFKKDQLWQVCGRSEVQRRPADLHQFNSGQGIHCLQSIR